MVNQLVTPRPITHPPRLQGDIYSFKSDNDEETEKISADEKVDQVIMILLPSLLAGNGSSKIVKANQKNSERKLLLH